MFVKVCGIRTREEVDWAVGLGFSAMGVVVHPRSVRCCGIEEARALAAYARGRITTVAVGVGFDEVACLYHDFDFVQAYEYRALDRLIYASENATPERDFAFYLFDPSRGSGTYRDFPEWLHTISDRLIISGGLAPDNVSAVVRAFRPFGVDVSSGVEAQKGRKDYHLMKKFITEVRNAVK